MLVFGSNLFAESEKDRKIEMQVQLIIVNAVTLFHSNKGDR